MSLDEMRSIDGYWYLGTPYSRYPKGLEWGLIDASRIAAKLVEHRIPVFSPIAHTHPVAIYGMLDPRDMNTWLWLDTPMMRAAHGLIVAQLPGWHDSVGLTHEITEFKLMEKPIHYLNPLEAPWLGL
jgi:hypothetical protein